MAKKDKDIFDKIMDWKIFGWFRPFTSKTKKCFLYLFFGVLTTAVSFGDRRHLKSAFGAGRHRQGRCFHHKHRHIMDMCSYFRIHNQQDMGFRV